MIDKNCGALFATICTCYTAIPQIFPVILAEQILLVDDDIDDQGFFCEALKETYPRFSCDIANTIAEALAKLKGNVHYNFIFLDLNLPGTDGFQFLELVKGDEKYQHIPVIILSTSSSPRDIEISQQLGADAFYTKGNSYSTILSMLKEVIG